jgi:probable rRNA maturation factor
MYAALDVQIATTTDIPNMQQLQLWVDSCLQLADFHSEYVPELSMRIVDPDEAKTLNLTWRGKDYATNVLSFPSDLPPELPMTFLGDIVICAAVVAIEAINQNKNWYAHWAHIVIHGLLHLLGFDHQDDTQAQQMENLEIYILQQLGYPNPYLIS